MCDQRKVLKGLQQCVIAGSLLKCIPLFLMERASVVKVSDLLIVCVFSKRRLTKQSERAVLFRVKINHLSKRVSNVCSCFNRKPKNLCVTRVHNICPRVMKRMSLKDQGYSWVAC